MDFVFGKIERELNKPSYIKNRLSKGFSEIYGNEIQRSSMVNNLLDQYKKLSEEKSNVELFPNRQQYYNNKDKYIDDSTIPDSLYKYKNPAIAYVCKCGWTYSSKNKKRIESHEFRDCPLNGYPPIPFLINDEFNGFNNNLPTVIGREIRFSDGFVDRTGIISKVERNCVVTIKIGRRKHVTRSLCDLRWHDTREIWV